MRLVALSLIVLNIAYFLWQFSSGDEPVSAPVIKPAIAPTIHLLSDDQRNLEFGQVIAEPLPDVRADLPGCSAIGPLPDLPTGQEVLERLVGLDLPVILQAFDEPDGDYDYRVMLRPAASPEAAFRKLRELQSLDIDSYVITTGKDALAISLGVYSTERAARAAQATHADDGYETIVATMTRINRSYWLIAEGEDAQSVPDAVFQDLQAQFDQISKKTMPCPRP